MSNQSGWLDRISSLARTSGPLSLGDVPRPQVAEALRLVFARSPLGPDLSAADYLQQATAQAWDLSLIQGAFDASGTVRWAIAPMIQGGGGVALTMPERPVRGVDEGVASQMIDRLAVRLADAGHTLLQGIVDPERRFVARCLKQGRFTRAASLLYLARRLGGDIPMADAIESVPYTPPLHDRFVRTLGRSYEGSLDCPAMAGLRTDEASFASHRQALFDPELWRLYLDADGRDLAIALVNPISDGGGFEIAYLGVVPEARGRSLGLGVVVDVIRRCVTRSEGVLMLVVDETNEPARHMYARAGFAFAQRRDAWVRSLSRPKSAEPSPAIAPEAKSVHR